MSKFYRNITETISQLKAISSHKIASSGFSKIKMSNEIGGKPRGALIVFEGCDRSGKTTQCSKLLEKLRQDGFQVESIKFPDRTTVIGHMINGYLEKKSDLEDHAVHLLFSANRWECVPRMKKLLLSGSSLIVDRYAFSGVAFTAAKEGFDIGWCKQPDIGLPRPDAVFYMTLSAEAAEKRAGFGGERYEETDFQKRVAKNFDLLKEPYWKIIDADRSIDDLHKELYQLTSSVIQSSRDKPIDTLWTGDKH